MQRKNEDMNIKELKKLEQLKERRNNLERQIEDLEYKEMIETSLPKLKKIIGKCFKYHNSYGGNYERWWLYVKVLSIDEKNMTFNCVEFQRTSMDIAEIKLEKKYNFRGKNYFDGMSYAPISQSEYSRAKRALKKFIIKKLEL